jgi:CRISPR-associated protein Cmr1
MPAVLKVELTSLTPCFLGGALPEDGGSAVSPLHWRGASLRGALRSWFRTLRLERADEARIFGGHGDGPGQAAILLRTGPTEAPRPLGLEEHVLRRFDRGRGRQTKNGLKYLGFPLLMRGNQERRALPPGSVWPLYLVDVRGDHEARRAVASALWLLTSLGGLGMRSRRGFGSLALTAWTSGHPEWKAVVKDLPVVAEAGTAGQLAALLGQGLDTLAGWFPKRTSSPDSKHEARLVPALQGAQIRLGSPVAHRADAWATVMAAAGDALQGFRDHWEPDYSDVREALVDRRSLRRTPSRAAFGLPLTFRTSAGRGTTMLLPRHRGVAYERYGSRLHLHIAQVGAQLVPVWTCLDAQWRQDDLDVVEQHQRGRPLAPPAEPDAVRRFLDEAVQGPRVAVSGGSLP